MGDCGSIQGNVVVYRRNVGSIQGDCGRILEDCGSIQGDCGSIQEDYGSVQADFGSTGIPGRNVHSEEKVWLASPSKEHLFLVLQDPWYWSHGS